MHREDPGDYREYAEYTEQSRSAFVCATRHPDKSSELGWLHSQHPPSVHTGR